MAMITRERVPVSFYTRKGVRVAYLCHETDWVPDSLRAACASCTAKFHVFNRKHHCRLCGEIICGGCSGVMAVHASNRIRACHSCIRSSLVEFTADAPPAVDALSTRVVMQTTTHPLYKDDDVAASRACSRSTAVIYLTCFIVLAHVFVGQDITSTFLTRLLK
ncbi:hypothetical protein DYB26_007376 [Aphanomyces astaci]|uniref:FYVE-type domain-containing protein n=1 Tax=Aphanomyces astaci TaxID=112090 RepID=A0A397DTU6_APHAT|nr:hypothetical protein DYB36_010985 [Aphanomyces astaci]RHY68226.1 hypothetical protein DYB38_013150 [Aphanomyces astaci]RHY86635.1 hypothetical protein DYB26_007376 [Aphanomyces astaci]RHZ13165.1 hypothetical protein DYB31_008050 [Aphanomyces astaci]